MKHLIFALAYCYIINLTGSIAFAQQNEEIKPYVDFLKQERQSAKDYILSLFKNNDIVILCERDHRDISQYKLISEVISDPYFIDSVGVIFTEIGAQNLNSQLNEFLRDNDLSKNEIDERILDFQRNASLPLWDKSNYSFLIKEIYSINRSILSGKKIEMYPTDIYYVEGELTTEKIKEPFTKNAIRDSLMADFIIRKFNELKQSVSCRKALVIMNYRHAMNCPIQTDGRIINNTGQYLFEKYQGKVANVLINNYRLVQANSDSDVNLGLIHDGRWDAAFKVVRYDNIGFNFKGTPFGNDNFDFLPICSNYTYEQMFTGFVFYLPIEKFKIAIGVPHLMENGFYNEYVKRMQLLYPGYTPNKDEIMKLNDIRIYNTDELDESKGLSEIIDKWLN